MLTYFYEMPCLKSRVGQANHRMKCDKLSGEKALIKDSSIYSNLDS